MVIAKQGLHPPDGYHFIEMNGTKITGRGWLEVERRVAHYRKTNKFPIGQPMTEIMEQAQKRNPNLFWEKKIRGE